MRFLFVYQDFAAPARELLQRLGVKDVTLVVARRGETAPNDAERDLIDCNPRATAALCQTHRTYKKFVEGFVDLGYIAKQFRVDDKQLEAWLLVPNVEEAKKCPAPSVGFSTHAEQCREFKLADGALDRADELDESRWPFAKKAADLLLRHVQKCDTGAMRDWKAAHGVDFAPNGKVRYEYTLSRKKIHSREWHLKEGDNTTQDRAARVYFDCFEQEGKPVVVIFYVGPHPPDGEYVAQFT